MRCREKSIVYSSVLIVVCLLFFSELVYAFHGPGLNSTIAAFEKNHSVSAVLILEAKTGRIAYVYNQEYALRRRFPPGSIAKTWSAAVLLENPSLFHFNAHRPVQCHGKFFSEYSPFVKGDITTFNLPFDQQSNRKYFRCSLKQGHGRVDLREALVKSCNVYFLSMASTRPRLFYELLLKTWHLNENTGARLIATRELPDRRPQSLTEFQYSASAIGEGGSIMVSPLTVAQTYAALFTNSPLLSPYEKGPARIITRHNLVVSITTRNILATSLSRVLSTGTLKKLLLKNHKVKLIAGKTGTGTHFRKKYATHGWNVICFSYQNTTHVLVTFVFKGSGSKEALELSRTVLHAL